MVHKTSWSVDEIKERLETADAKTRWTNTQVEALMAQINNLNNTVERLQKEQLFLTSLLDETKISEEPIRTAAEVMGIRLPKIKKK